jgi:capsular exopolysaccharide synthesis family protein
LHHYLGVIRRGWWIIALTAIMATAAGVLLSRGQDTTYRASAAVFLGARNSAFLFSGIPEPYVDAERYLQNQANIARLPAVAELAVKDVGIPGYTAGRLLGGASVTPAADADLLTFSVSDSDPSVAAEAATSYARAYMRYKQQVDNRTIAQTRSRYEQQIKELEKADERGSARYDELVAQYERLRTLELLQSSSALTIRPATGAAAGSGPQPVRNGTLALVLGLMLGVGLVFARDALNTRIRSEAEVEERLGLPLLGRIPEPPRSLRRKDRLVMLDDPRSPEAEAFRILATNVELVNLDHGARTIVVTSALGGEGKSTTVANLAVAFARAGRRVVLVDLDLRRSSLARFFVSRNEPAIGTLGLTHVALGRATLEQALLPVPIDDAVLRFDQSSNGGRAGVLEVLQTGPITPNPAEFIVSHTLEDVLSQLAERADVVLIDAAPLLNLSDTVALSSKVDALIVVVHSGSTRRPVLGELQRVLDSARAVKLGFVFSGVTGDEAFGSAYGSGNQPARTTRAGQRTVA